MGEYTCVSLYTVVVMAGTAMEMIAEPSCKYDRFVLLVTMPASLDRTKMRHQPTLPNTTFTMRARTQSS